jgi:16S rRNA (cytosine1402-N4)-methyltransferase
MIEHKPVLLEESIEGLNLKKGETVVDATLGGGGHAVEILKKIGKEGRLVAIDVDEQSVSRFSSKLKAQSSKSGIWQSEAGNQILVKDNFSNLENILGGQGIKSVDGILADLGYSSLQLEDERYGMSFLQDAPLDMRLSLRNTNSYEYTNEQTAKDIINDYPEQELFRIIKKFGEERFAKNIAKKIVENRKIKPIEKTIQLVEIIKSAIPDKYKHGRIHPATKTFQALRIAVNKEIENLEKFIPQAVDVLKPGGRLAIISFHSGEDRIVKNIFRENARGCICPSGFPQCRCGQKPKIKIITKKPIVPGAVEIENNPRSRSAKLRIAEKI